MPTRPQSPQPSGTPRWVAMVYEPSSEAWAVCAESPHRSPVQYALAEMAHTVRARGDDLEVTLWGPRAGAWERFDAFAATTATAPVPKAEEVEASSSAPEQPSRLTERMDGRRRQVLVAGLGKAGLHDLGPDDFGAVEALAERLDETTVRRVAHWLALAAGRR
ncbi:hypothetical protein [Streptomyces sp. CdTB01]|uniref:hypothetical protein n=1 Tax=Streptomyces sp. CdTB01 TaxID=1725411 RepID=UPI001EEF9D3C|nr:hypothetical protein [Streptomyces sp. CdTB01]